MINCDICGGKVPDGISRIDNKDFCVKCIHKFLLRFINRSESDCLYVFAQLHSIMCRASFIEFSREMLSEIMKDSTVAVAKGA